MAPDFVHLHVHSHFSLLDGCASPESIARAVSELGQPAVALTDHGNLHGLVPFVRAAREAGIKPIVGCEAYVSSTFGNPWDDGAKSSPFHVTLLAQDARGYANLCRLSTAAHLRGGKYPVVDAALLAEFNDGLVALSGCLRGEVPCYLGAGDADRAREAAAWFKDVFGPDRFYLELMDHGLEIQAVVNEGLLRLHRELGLPLAATNDVHYAKAEDSDVQHLLHCIDRGAKTTDADVVKFPSNQRYLKSFEEMAAMFGQWESALANTVAIAERCSFELPIGNRPLPEFSPGRSSDQLLREKVYEGAKKRYSTPLSPRVQDRVEHELAVIQATGFADYFLIVGDIVRFAKDSGIPVGPGRGSSASSIVAYALDITEVDPLEHGLLFERFLNPERATMPDIDLDFCYERRQEALEYVVRRYGEDRVAQIGAFAALAAKAAVRDAGRALDIPHSIVDGVARRLPTGIGLREAITSPEIQQVVEKAPDARRLLEAAIKVEGAPRHLTVHAAGIVIAAKPLEAEAPLCRSPEGARVTQFTGDDLEALGYLKVDLLGLRTLTVIRDALEFIKNERGVELDLDDIPLDDAAVYETLSRGEAEGVFQLETPMFQTLLQQVRPQRFEDLVAILALGRPGAMAHRETFLKNRFDGKAPRYRHPALEAILAETHGVMLYQEQVMRVAAEIAGYTLQQADALRRAMGRKLPHIMEQERERFLQGSAERGVEPAAAEAIFADVARFAEYGFPKSHSVAYSLVAYRTAYLKVHYPAEYMAAQLGSVVGDDRKLGRYLRECRRLGIELSGPDVNQSDIDFRLDGGAIRFGLASVKNVGQGFAAAIVKERQRGPYASLLDFCERMAERHVSRAALESLIRAGAFDALSLTRSAGVALIDQALAAGQRAKQRLSQKQEELFSNPPTLVEPAWEAPEEFPLSRRLADEIELLGAPWSAHPLDPHLEALAPFTFGAMQKGDQRSVAGVVVEVKRVRTRNNDPMAFAVIEDAEGERGEVTLFPRTFQGGPPVDVGSVIVVEGEKSSGLDGVKVAADSYVVVEGDPVVVEARSADALPSLKDLLGKGGRRRPVILRLIGREVVARLVLPPNFWVLPGDVERLVRAAESKEEST